MHGQVDPAALHAALAAVPPGAWSLPSTFEATGVHHGYRRVVLVDHGRELEAAWSWSFVLGMFAPVHTSWLSWIDPGGFIVPHRDASPWFERWQVPIRANGVFSDHNPRNGVPFRVEHWRPHAVWNDTDQPRVHLVIDRDVGVDQPPAPFETYPVPDDYAHLVARAR